MLPAPIYFSQFHFWKCPGWKKGRVAFFSGSCLIVIFFPFFCHIFQTSCFWGCDLTYLHSSEHESSVLMVELQKSYGLVWKGPLKTIQFQSPAVEGMCTEWCRALKGPYPTHRTMVQTSCADTHNRRVAFHWFYHFITQCSNSSKLQMKADILLWFFVVCYLLLWSCSHVRSETELQF